MGVSLRSLQRSFSEQLGVTPRAYLSRLRVEAMNSALRDGDPRTTVTSAALDAGLLHLGRSSALYRGHFGELPSDTLRRARG